MVPSTWSVIPFGIESPPNVDASLISSWYWPGKNGGRGPACGFGTWMTICRSLQLTIPPTLVLLSCDVVARPVNVRDDSALDCESVSVIVPAVAPKLTP